MQAFMPVCSQTHIYNLKVNQSQVWSYWRPYNRFPDSGLPFVSPSVPLSLSIDPKVSLQPGLQLSTGSLGADKSTEAHCVSQIR